LDNAKFFDSGGRDLLSAQILGISPPIAKKQGKDVLRKVNGLIRYHFHVDPDQLSDEQYSEHWQQLKWVLDFESKRFSLKDGQNSIKL
jgi:hypothetical protein